MKQTLFVRLMFVAGTVWLANQLWSTRLVGAMPELKHARPAIDLSFLPSNLVIPPALPAGLEDPLLIEAWVRLYNHETPIELWDGTPITGRILAQALVDLAIPLVWDIEGYCGNASCSHQFCAGETCVYEDGQPGVDPIHINPLHAADMETLVVTLAHESFHRMMPFGPVHDSKFEDFWACKVSAAFDTRSGFTFDNYDPWMSGYQLLWIRDNGLTPYYSLPDYPPVIAAQLN